MQIPDQFQKPIYLDNAATSWPKPEAVYAAVDNWQRNNGTAAGRSSCRRAQESGAIVNRARRLVATLFNSPQSDCIVFTHNGTDSLNIVLHGLLQPGDRVVTTAAEHNSVLRPLRELQSCGVSTEVVPVDATGRIDWDAFRQALQAPTRLVVMTHASNVTGTIQLIAEAGELARAAGARFLVDAAQTAGHHAIDLKNSPIDFLACPGHKGLLGPLGTGVLYIAPGCEEELRSFRQGGTGTRSEEETQPNNLPEKYEAGNHNVPGLAGLAAGIEWILQETVPQIAAHLQALTGRLLEGLRAISGVTIHGVQQADAARRTAVISISLENFDPAELALILDGEFGIETRAGLHCAPRIHHALGTVGMGTLRFSPGPFTTEEDIDAVLNALRRIAE